MTTILILTPSLTHGGAEVQSRLLLMLLNSKLHASALAKDRITLPSVIPFSKVFINFIYLCQIFQLCSNNRVTHVISFLPQSHVFAIFAKLVTRGKLIVSIRNDLRYCRSSLEDAYSYKFDILCSFIDAFSVQSDQMFRFLQWRLRTDKRIHIIPNILDRANNACSIMSSQDHKDGIIIVQRMSLQKDPNHMIRLCQHINPRIPIDIYGDGEFLSLTRRRLSNYPNIAVHGRIEKQEILKTMATKRLGILTSFYEGMPNVISEYIQHQCLPLSTPNEYHEYLSEGFSSLLRLRGIDPQQDANIVNSLYFTNYNTLQKINSELHDRLCTYHSSSIILDSWLHLCS